MAPGMGLFRTQLTFHNGLNHRANLKLMRLAKRFARGQDRVVQSLGQNVFPAFFADGWVLVNRHIQLQDLGQTKLVSCSQTQSL